MTGRLSASTSGRNISLAADLSTPFAPSSALKRSLHTSGLASDTTTPSLKRRAFESTTTGKTPSSLERIQAEQERRQLVAQLSAAQRELVDAQTATREAQAALKERDARVARLERDRETIAERELEARRERKEVEERLRSEKEAAERERDEARGAEEDAKGRADRGKAEARRQAHEAELAKTRAASAMRQVETLQIELEKSDEALEKARIAHDAAEEARESLIKQNEELQRRIRDGAGDEGGNQVVREELHRQVTLIKTLTAENTRFKRENEALKTRAADADMLREQVRTLDARLKLTDQLRRRLAASEADVDSLRSQQEEWQAYLREDETETFESPRQVGRALAAARLEIIGLQERMGQRSADLKARDALVATLEARLDEAEYEVRTAQEAQVETETRRAREARMTDLVRREANMLREQLRTYAVEETALASSTGRAEAIAGLEEVLDAHKRELADAIKEADRLRGMLDANGAYTTKLEDVTSLTSRWRTEGKLGESLSEALKVAESLREDLSAARHEADMAAKEVASLETTIERLTKAVGRGEYDRSTTRVLELTDNPAAQDLAIRQATLDTLKAENAALLARLEKAPAASTASSPVRSGHGSVPRETLEALRKEKEALEAELDSIGKKSQRLKESFKERAAEFRTAIHNLFGFRIDLKEGGRIRLTSIFAPSKEDYIIFEPTRAGSSTLQLLGGTGEAEWAKTEQVKSALQFWINDRQCIPGFLSTLTLEGYEAATRGGKHLGFTQG